MEEEKTADDIQATSTAPLPTGFPINWGLITGPVPEPVFPAPPSLSSLNTSLPPPAQSSAVHALQTKVKSLTQRRSRGRDREKDREKFDTETLVSNPAGHISSEVLLRQRPKGKGQLFLPAPSWRSGAAKDLSSSDEEEEVEVQVRLEIHSPPAEAHVEQQEGEVGEESTEKNEGQVSHPTGQPFELGEGTSLESLLSDDSTISKDGPSPPPPLPVFSSSPATISATTTASFSSSSSSPSARHWAPPKGFWRVARPETLLLNGVGPHNIPPSLPLKDYTQTEALAEPQRKPKSPEIGNRKDAGGQVNDCDASSEIKNSDSVERLLDKCEQREPDITDPSKGLCSSDSSESMSSQSGVLCADNKLKVKERAYAKLRERQQHYKEARELHEGEIAGYYEETTYRVDYNGRSLEENNRES